MNNNEKRGKFIAELRKEKGYTQQELGKLLNYSDKAISRWELGEATINLDVIKELSNIFDVSIAELIFGERKVEENEQEIQDNIEEELTKNYHKYRKNSAKVIILFMSIIIVVLIATYMIFIRNTILVYSIMGENNNISEKNGTLILSNKLSILNFNKLTLKNNKVIEDIRIYYIGKNKKKIDLFYGSNDNYYIEEKNGYEEYHLKSIPKGEMILEIKYTDDSKETLKLELQRKFVNDSIFPKKASIISDRTYENNQSKEQKMVKLISLGFEMVDDEYKYIINENTICYVSLDAARIRIDSVKNDSKEELFSYIDEKELFYTLINKGNNINSESIHLEDNETRNCNEEKCTSKDDYIMYIAFLKEQLK